jgi:hypothetical protein
MVIVMVSCYLMFDSYFLLLLNLCYQLFYKKLNVFLILHFNQNIEGCSLVFIIQI